MATIDERVVSLKMNNKQFLSPSRNPRWHGRNSRIALEDAGKLQMAFSRIWENCTKIHTSDAKPIRRRRSLKHDPVVGVFDASRPSVESVLRISAGKSMLQASFSLRLTVSKEYRPRSIPNHSEAQHQSK